MQGIGHLLAFMIPTSCIVYLVFFLRGRKLEVGAAEIPDFYLNEIGFSATVLALICSLTSLTTCSFHPEVSIL